MDDIEEELTVIDVDPELATALGGFMVTWGQLESELDGFFPVIFRIDPTLSLCISANLGTKAKVDILRSAVSLMSPLLPKDLAEEADKTLAFTLDWTAKARTPLAHGQPTIFIENDGTENWIWTRLSVRKKLKFTAPGNVADHWQTITVVTYEVAKGLRSTRARIHEALKSCTRDQIEHACLLDLEYE